MFFRTFFSQLGAKIASAATGYINRQKPSGNSALATKPIRRSTGLFRTVLLTMGAGSGLSFGPVVNEMAGLDSNGAMGILVGIFGIVCGLCISRIYMHRYQRSYNGWPWLLLGVVSWLGGGILTILLLLVIIAVFYLASVYLAILLLPLAIGFLLTLFRIFWRW